MRNKAQIKHHIEILFPIVLFIVFAFAAITVVLFAARIYKHGVDTAEQNYSARTSLTYCMEKIRRNDVSGTIETGSRMGEDTLILTDPEEREYCTCIYVYDGYLRELYMRYDAEIPPEAGTEVLPLSAFSAEEIADGLIRLTCTDESGVTVSESVAVRSGEVSRS